MNSTSIPAHAAAEQSSLVVERFLRDREGIWQQIRLGYSLNGLIQQMVTSSAIALGCYGLVMGSSHSLWQAFASAIKLPILFLLTLAICLPTLYLFNLLCGGQLSVRQALAVVLATITVTSTLTLAFAPITLFFLITAHSYHFFILLNTAVLALTGVVGLSFLVGGIRSMNQQALAEPLAADSPQTLVSRPRPVNMRLLQFWIVLYGFVGTQLAWTLRPFHNDPSRPFILLRPVASNFYVGVIHTLVQLLHR